MTATTATKLLIGVVIFVGMPLLAWGWADVSGFFANWARFGYVVVALIFLGMYWAEASLGRQFSVLVTLQDDHRLITEGPYRYLRHPRYLGIIGFATGIALVFRSGPGLGLAALLAVVLLLRIRDEEKLLHGEFGEEWEAYVNTSWRLIPFVY